MHNQSVQLHSKHGWAETNAPSNTLCLFESHQLLENKTQTNANPTMYLVEHCSYVGSAPVVYWMKAEFVLMFLLETPVQRFCLLTALVLILLLDDGLLYNNHTFYSPAPCNIHTLLDLCAPF